MKEKQTNPVEEKLIFVAFAVAAVALAVIVVLQLVKVLTAGVATMIFMFIMFTINLLCSFVIRRDNKKLANFFLYNTLMLFILSIIMLISLL